MSDLSNLFSDRTALNRSQNSAILSLHKTIVPYLLHATEHIHKSATTLSPIAGSCNVHNIEERKRRDIAGDELNDKNKRSRTQKTSPLKRIENFSKSVVITDVEKINNKGDRIRTRTIQPKKLFHLPTAISTLPPPENKREYQPPEVIKLITKHAKGSSARSTIVSYIITKNSYPSTVQLFTN